MAGSYVICTSELDTASVPGLITTPTVIVLPTAALYVLLSNCNEAADTAEADFEYTSTAIAIATIISAVFLIKWQAVTNPTLAYTAEISYL